MKRGLLANKLRVGTVMCLALRGTWTFLGPGDVWKREKQQRTE